MKTLSDKIIDAILLATELSEDTASIDILKKTIPDLLANEFADFSNRLQNRIKTLDTNSEAYRAEKRTEQADLCFGKARQLEVVLSAFDKIAAPHQMAASKTGDPIEIKHIPPPLMTLYNPKREVLGTLNEYEMMDVRVQISRKRLRNYFVVFHDQRIRIDHFGEFDRYPKGFFDTINDYLLDLIELRGSN